MLKKISSIAVIIITAFFIGSILLKNNNRDNLDNEVRGIFISYIEYLEYFQNKEVNQIKQKIEDMIVNLKNKKINTIYLQVRPFSDSIYNSKIFPFSHTISGTQGKSIDLDILAFFIENAHHNKIKIHAWINPYRISNDTNTDFLSVKNPAYKWLNTNHVKIIKDKGIYYNPASDEVRKLIVSGIEELIINYEIDGILFDDYFYPDNTIDLENYKEFENTISTIDFRLNNTNTLISDIYKTIKKENPNVLFGISPDGNIENNYNIHYADVKKWLSEENYIDYIMPQIYYGFLHETKPFIKTINEWKGLIKNDVKLIPTLSLYKSGEVDIYAGKGKDEWIENTNIIKKQIQVSRNIKHYSGFSLYRYNYLTKESKNPNLQTEIENYLYLFKK